MLEHLGWRELLGRWSGEAIDHEDALPLTVTDEARASRWLGGPPATPGAVARAEERLGVTLPPSYRSFLALTDGWPVLSFDFDAVRPVADLGWVRDLAPELLEAWDTADDAYAVGGEPVWEEGSDDGPPLLRRSLLLNTGTDAFLLDSGRVNGDGEWASCDFTSWHPGAGGYEPSFRAGMESHYASFVRFEATQSVTHAEVADRIERAYRACLAGDRREEHVIDSARSFGSARADVLQVQVDVFTGKYRAGLGVLGLDVGTGPVDPAVASELWPMLVFETFGPHGNGTWAIDQLLSRLPAGAAESLRRVVVAHRGSGGLRADFGHAPGFAAGVERARAAARTGRDDEAFAEILAALPLWQPRSPNHLAPVGLVWDRELAPVLSDRARRERVLDTPRGTGHQP